MTIPQVSLLVAFAIGLPLGIVGYFLQEALIKRRRRRAHAAVEAGTGWGEHAVATPTGTRTGTGTAVTGHAGRSAAVEVEALEEVEPAPPRGAAEAEKRRTALLRKHDAQLQQAVEAMVDFIEAPPRKARAVATAARVSALVPASRRGAALVAFLDGVAAGTTPSASQDAAEAAGIELARELRVVKQELLDLDA